MNTQQRVQEELRASEEKFSGILAIAADAIVTVDNTLRIVHFNRGAEEIFGYTSADAIGRHLNILIPARYWPNHDRHMESFARSGVTARRMGERREIFGLRSDGSEFPAEASISKLVTPDGILFTVLMRDITAQKRAEESERYLALAAGEMSQTLAMDVTLRTVVDLPIPRLADAAFLDVVDPNGGFRRVGSTRQRADINAAVTALGAHQLTEDSPSPIVDVVRRGRTEVVNDIHEDWYEANADPEAIPYWRALAPHGVMMIPLRAAGETLGALTLIRTNAEFDNDARMLAEKYTDIASTTIVNARLYELAQHATQARDDVLSVVSHDLRNPLSAIAMSARVLQDSPPTDPAGRRELLEAITRSTELMNRLIQDLLDVTMIERGKLSLQRRDEEPARLAMQAMQLFELEANENKIDLQTRIATNLPLVHADAERIVQALANLLRNALKFTPEGGRVSLDVSEHEGRVLFSVVDTGRGIRAEDIPHLFDRYWQSGEGARARGTGLGLSITKGIIDAHGGRISVESEPGRGSTFSVSLPAA